MKTTGIIRRIDDLGRIVIPKELRRSLRIKTGESLEIFVENEDIILKKYSPMESIEEAASKYVDSFDLESVCESSDVSPSLADYQGMLNVTHWPASYDPVTGSKLIKVTMTVQIKDRKDNSDIIYQIRN